MNPTNSSNPITQEVGSAASQHPSLKAIRDSSWDSSAWLRFTLLAIITITVTLILYRTAVWRLVEAVLGREGSSHGVFVPLISGYFLWTNRKAILNIEFRYHYAGITLVLIGILFPILNIGIFQLECLSYMVFISGVIILFLGIDFLKEVSFPLFFLITMIPLPHDFYISLANITRDITFGGSSWIISLLGISYFREGYLIHLPNTVLNVATGCSGIRYLVSYFVFSLAYAYLFRKATWSRISLVVCTIPISLIASILRLTFIFLLTYVFGPHMAEYWPHVFISWSVFFIVLLIAIGLDQFFQGEKAKKLEG